MGAENPVPVPGCFLTATQQELVGKVLHAFSTENGGSGATETAKPAEALTLAALEALNVLSTTPHSQVEVRGVVFERTPPPPTV